MSQETWTVTDMFLDVGDGWRIRVYMNRSPYREIAGRWEWAVYRGGLVVVDACYNLEDGPQQAQARAREALESVRENAPALN